jgi:HAMP domain-containing protein
MIHALCIALWVLVIAISTLLVAWVEHEIRVDRRDKIQALREAFGRIVP